MGLPESIKEEFLASKYKHYASPELWAFGDWLFDLTLKMVMVAAWKEFIKSPEIRALLQKYQYENVVRQGIESIEKERL